MARIGYNIPGNKLVASTTFLNDPTLTENDKLINNLGDDYINVLNEDTSFFEVMVWLKKMI